MFKRGCGLEVLLVLWGLELSWSCPRHCICYTAPSTVSCQAHNFLSVPEGIPADSERIFLQNNRIRRLQRGHFSATTIKLWIYSNNISYIEPSTFLGFSLLEELDLGDNRHLRALAPDTFHGLSRLHALHLYRCGLTALPPGIFQGLRNLQYLYLQDNHLELLQDDLFVDLQNLSHLFLHGNRLWSLHQNTFRGLRALDRLLLHHNRLQWVDRLAFHDMQRLTTLYLFNNSLTQLPAECLAQLPALEYLRLNDNPWDCGCRALLLWDWLRRFRGSTSEVGCHEPPGLAGRDLKQLRREELPTCSGSESLHQSKAGPRSGADTVSLKKEGQPPPYGGREPLPPPSPLPHPPPASSGLPPGGASAQRPRNCTRQRGRGGKAKGQNGVHALKEMTGKEYLPPDFGPEDSKYDHGIPNGVPPRRKHKCTPRPSMRPPSGVLQATNQAMCCRSQHLLCAVLGILVPLTSVILR
uniref:Reticulon 4 receptor like 1 n=1 Tax=Paramormyrops kingsleyae TaxID=1676925 RepID=A0A3B3S4K5_9TELE|nr:reticulon-4 receptor-like 1 [Paramormyrops kingsleyae]